ncbi:MAG: DUF4102 domain-containing protein [Oceanospirillaceae bacterium]|nr:DUF4102 domain-containing protein [Oceanospirillaceae bacterium]
MALSDLIVRQARATGKTYNLPDTYGLGLVVSPTGGKSWHLRYLWLGKQKRMLLGTYPKVGLRQTRALRDEARELLAKSINPHTDRKQKRRAVRLADEHTFEAVFQAWVEHRRKELKEGRQSSLSQILRIFAKDVTERVAWRGVARYLRAETRYPIVHPADAFHHSTERIEVVTDISKVLPRHAGAKIVPIAIGDGLAQKVGQRQAISPDDCRGCFDSELFRISKKLPHLCRSRYADTNGRVNAFIA